MNQVDDYEYFCHSCEDVKRTSDVEIICDGELKCKSCNNVGFVEKIDEDDPVSFHSVHYNRDNRSNANNSDQNSPNNSNRNSSHTRSSNGHRNSSSHIGGSRSNGNYRIEFTNSGNAFNPNDNIFSDMMFFRNMYQQIYSTGFRTVDGNINFTSHFEPSTNSNRANEASAESNNGNNARNSGNGNGNRNDWFSRVFFGTNSRPSNLSSNNTSNNSSSNNDNNNGGTGASQNNNTRNIRNPRIVTRAIDITNIPLNSPIRLNFHDIIDNILTNSFDNISLDQVLTIIMESDPSRNGPPPASEEIIKNLKVEKLTLERAQELESCAICREEYKENDEVHRITDNERCRHVFHCDCIIPWLKERNSCPTCRFELPTDDQEYNCKREELRERINSEISRNNSLNNSNNVDVSQDESGTGANNGETNDGNGAEEKPDNENEERTDGENRNRETNENGDRTSSRNRRGNESGSRTETRYLQFGDENDLNGLGDFTTMNTSSIIQNIFNNFINGTNNEGSGVSRIFFPQQGSNRNGNRNSDARNIFEESQLRPEHVIVNITGSIDEISGFPTSNNNIFQNSGRNEANNNRERGPDNGNNNNNNNTTNRNASNERNGSRGRDNSSSAPRIGENIFGTSNFFSSSNLSGLQNLFDSNNLFDTASVIITNISNHNNPSSSTNSGSMRFPNVFNNINEFYTNISNLHGERNGSASSPTDSNNNQANNTNNKENPKNASDEAGNNNKNGTKKIEKRIYEKVQPSYNERDNNNNNSSGSRRSRNDDTEEEIIRKKSKNCENYDDEDKYTEMNRSTNRDNNKEDEENEKSNTSVTNSGENNGENGDNNSECKNPEKQKTVKKYIFNKFNWLKNYDNKEKKKKTEKNNDKKDSSRIQDDDINYNNEKEGNTIESETLGKDNKSGYSVEDGGNEEANKSDTYLGGKGKEDANDMKENFSND
ncbi:E3 ubiquitin-protein ligase, putative [Plasmodium chabaudi chabaudi]|uniref:E3 ubiquitin-protein ligase, putative n=1 Tax=Plasmodium chabaudi chabaudi TaxID=31271 RepID=A0A1C6YLN0_PLACU|nr:E3 ubiquitin-protein ligase, putative [Plasmodium chabaudi chabaudi]